MGGSFLLALLENRFRHIARLVYLRPVDFRFGFGFVPGGGRRNAAASEDMRANALGFMLFNRAGVRLLLGHADCGQSIENFFALDLQFTR